MTRTGESDVLRAALVAAYAPYVRGLLAERDMGAAGMDGALDEGRLWLDTALEGLLSLPFGQQPRGPLEVFQEAMRFPTEALRSAGLEAPTRDAAVREALPGDAFDLAPASSQALGQEVWEAHIAWGAAKARAFRPSVGLLSQDLMDRSKIAPVVADAGFRLAVWSRSDELALGDDRPSVAFVDLAHRDADDVIRALSDEGIRVIGYGPHVDDLAMVRARSLGASDALPRSVFFRTVGRLLPTFA